MTLGGKEAVLGPMRGFVVVGLVITEVALVAHPVIRVDVSTADRDCDRVFLRDGDARFRSTCDSGGGLTHIGMVLAGDYRLCLDKVCADVTVAATPAHQVLELPSR